MHACVCTCLYINSLCISNDNTYYVLSPVDGHTLAEIEREEEDEDESEAAQSDITEKDDVCSIHFTCG